MPPMWLCYIHISRCWRFLTMNKDCWWADTSWRNVWRWALEMDNLGWWVWRSIGFVQRRPASNLISCIGRFGRSVHGYHFCSDCKRYSTNSSPRLLQVLQSKLTHPHHWMIANVRFATTAQISSCPWFAWTPNQGFKRSQEWALTP